jgi:hypothetical protein
VARRLGQNRFDGAKRGAWLIGVGVRREDAFQCCGLSG